MIRHDTAYMQLNFFPKQKFLLYVYLYDLLCGRKTTSVSFIIHDLIKLALWIWH